MARVHRGLSGDVDLARVFVRRARVEAVVDRKTRDDLDRERASIPKEPVIRPQPDPPFYDEAPPQRPGDGDGDSGQPQQPAGDAVR